MRELGVQAVPHGFRSSFRDWAAECSDAPREVCELALAHVNSDRVEAAYWRSDLFERRRRLMEEWSDYVPVRFETPQGLMGENEWLRRPAERPGEPGEGCDHGQPLREALDSLSGRLGRGDRFEITDGKASG